MTVPVAEDIVRSIYQTTNPGTFLADLCESHERFRYELQGAEKMLAEDGKDLCWRSKLRDFADNSSLHQFDRDDWRLDIGAGIALYRHDDFFAAYFNDATDLWDRANDERPMHHVMVRSDPPHRAVIHKMHLMVWVAHLSDSRLPVQIWALAHLTHIAKHQP